MVLLPVRNVHPDKLQIRRDLPPAIYVPSEVFKIVLDNKSAFLAIHFPMLLLRGLPDVHLVQLTQ